MISVPATNSQRLRPTLVALIAATLAVGLVVASVPAHAQDNAVTNEDFNATVPMPEAWAQLEGNERAVFAFQHEETQSQIEIVATELMTADVADVFFNTFHETLTSSEFTEIGAEDKTYGERSGKETIYEFTHSGVDLKVAVFQFLHEDTAWLVVGYMQAEVFDDQRSAFESVVTGLEIGE